MKSCLRRTVLIPIVACLCLGAETPSIAASADGAVDADSEQIPTGPQGFSLDRIREALGGELSALVAGLDDRQRRKALYAFDDDERFDLRLAPIGLEGLRIDEMSDAQWRALESMLGEVLSPAGLEKMNTIRSLEREVAELENGFFGFLMDRMRDAKRYFLTIYGDPRTDGTWALRFDGHHYSLNLTAVPGAQVSATPLFMGGQPRVVPEELQRAGLRVLADEEEFAVSFLNALSAEQRAVARIPWQEGSAIRRPMSITGDVDLERPEPSGIRRAALDADLRARFDALVDVHLGNFAPTLANRYRARLLDSRESLALEFAAANTSANESDAEPVAAGRALYYRIQGGDILIEFDDTAEAADHIHVVIRDLASDFGRDALGEHRVTLH